MDAVTYLKEKNRLTDNCNMDCDECRLFKFVGETGRVVNCDKLESSCPEKAVEIIEQWSKENPAETYKSMFLKAFPKAEIKDTCLGQFGRGICRNDIFQQNINCEEEYKNDCLNCWNQPYKE